jgi:cellulose synthase/poly-beta-1,6-N-acetylglucosamine synthase-like glycosyltransferase
VTIIGVLLSILAVVVAIPCAVLFVECMVALLPGADTDPLDTSGPRPRTAVLIPAHNESSGIAPTIAGLRAQLGPADRLIVIADNCSDDTAAVARAAGAEAIERQDTTRRGKGFAIVFAVDHLAANPPEAVIIVDADCRISEGGLERLSREAVATNRPVQGEYVLAAPERPTPKGVISALAVLLRNRVRPLGMRRMGFPAHLTGSGMSFPWAILRAAPHPGGNLVEDLVMGIEFALAGHPPLHCRAVQVMSELPEGDDVALGQRRRWEHGQMATLLHYAPKLLSAGLTRLRPSLLAMGLDLAVPPLALLVMLAGGSTVLAALAAWAGLSATPLAILLGGLVLLAVAVLATWAKFGGDKLPLRYAVVVPLYVLWKIPMYFTFFLKGKHKTWDRTKRKGEGDKV